MRLLLVALILVGAPAEKPLRAAPQKRAPSRPKKNEKHRAPAHPPAWTPRNDKPKTAMA